MRSFVLFIAAHHYFLGCNVFLYFLFFQPRSQGHFPGLRAGREKTLASAGHVSTLHPENLGVIN